MAPVEAGAKALQITSSALELKPIETQFQEFSNLGKTVVTHYFFHKKKNETLLLNGCAQERELVFAGTALGC